MSKKTLLTSIAVAVALASISSHAFESKVNVNTSPKFSYIKSVGTDDYIMEIPAGDTNSTSSHAFESKVNVNTVAKVSGVKSVETDHSKVDLPVVDTASVASVSSHGIFSGQSLKLYNVEVVRKEIKSSADVSPMISMGKLYVARGAKPQGGHVFSIASAASTSPFVYAFTKEKTYIKDLSVENKQDGSVSATIVPGMVDEGVTLVVDTKRTKENILISTISLSEKRIGSMNESEEHVSRPDTSVFTASNRVVSHPGETIVIHSPPYKQDGKNFQNEYYLTIR